MAAGKGFEGMVTAIAQGLGVAENGIRDVAYGKANGDGGIRFPGNKKKTNGLIPILREINKIDMCNIINYALKSISLTEGVLGEKLKGIREGAQALMDLLDGGLLANPAVISAEEVAVLVGLLQKLDEDIDGDVVALFPKVQTYKNDINNVIGILIHYNAAVASYDILKKAVDQANGSTPISVSTLTTTPTANTTTLDPQAVQVTSQTSNSTTTVSSTLTATNTTTNIVSDANGQVLFYEPGSTIISVPSGDIFGVATYTPVQVPNAALDALQRASAISKDGNLTQDILSQIANEEVQKVLRTIQEVKQVLRLIIGFTSVSDIASTLIPNEIKELQKIVSPTKLIPIIKFILTLAKGFNQIVQKILNYVGIAKTIVKVLQILIDVMRIAIWVFRVLPMPLMFATSGIMDGLVWARQLLDNILDNAEKIVGQIGKLIDIIYEFFTIISQIIQEVIQQIEILLFTLESCAGVDEAKAIRELKEVKSSLQYTENQVNSLTANYRAALVSSNKKVYNGYTMEIQEEEVFDETVRYKRRRAIAFDSSGVLVEATDLTFATDKTLLFEELRLKLVNSGYIQDSGAFVSGLDFLGDVLGINADLPTTTTDIYASIGITTLNGMDPQQLMKDEASVVKKQINAVIDNIKGGADLRKSSQASVQESNVKLKENIQSGIVNPAANQPITGGVASPSTPVINKGGTANPDILSDSEVARLKKIKQSVDENPQSERLKNTQTYKLAVQKLAADEEARKQENK